MTRYTTTPPRAAYVRNPSQEDIGATFHRGGLYDLTLDVYAEDDWRPTGILDANGRMTWATDKGPLGFGRPE